MVNQGSKFSREFPFGSTLGFMTTNGAITIPDEVFHGYVYQASQGWILHSTFPEQKGVKKVQKRRKMSRKPG